jgi:hypothetical protein
MGRAGATCLAFATLAGLASCVDRSPGAGDAGAVGAWSLSPEPLLEIGEVDGDPGYLFSRISDVRLLPGGGVAVADAGLQAVRLYAPDGRFLRDLGRQGQGPGEFTSIMGLRVVAPDTVLAYDAAEGRLTTFLASGELLSTQPFRGDDGFPEAYIGAFDDGGHAVAWIARAPRDPSQVTPDPMQIGRFGPDGGLRSILGSAPGMRRLRSPLPFSPHFLAAMSGDSVFFTDGSDGRITVAGPDGGPGRTFRVEAERPEAEDAWRSLEELIEDPDQFDALRGLRDLPGADSVPIFSELRMHDEDRLWLKRYEPATDSHRLSRRRTGGEWLVVERDGRVIARVAIPDGFRPEHVKGDRVAGVALDELGVERVRVYELVGRE